MWSGVVYCTKLSKDPVSLIRSACFCTLVLVTVALKRRYSMTRPYGITFQKAAHHEECCGAVLLVADVRAQLARLWIGRLNYYAMYTH